MQNIKGLVKVIYYVLLQVLSYVIVSYTNTDSKISFNCIHSCEILLLCHSRWQQSGGVHCRALNSNHIYSKNPPAIQKAQGLRREQNVHKNPLGS